MGKIPRDSLTFLELDTQLVIGNSLQEVQVEPGIDLPGLNDSVIQSKRIVFGRTRNVKRTDKNLQTLALPQCVCDNEIDSFRVNRRRKRTEQIEVEQLGTHKEHRKV